MCNCVDIDLLRAVDELSHDDGVQRRDGGGGREIVFESRFLVNDVHGGTGENVRWANENGISVMLVSELSSWNECLKGVPNALRERFRSFNTRHFSPFWLVYANLVEDRGEFMPVLCHIDLLGVRSEHLDATLFEAQCDILRQLT
jgi:hypothetical protein